MSGRLTSTIDGRICDRVTAAGLAEAMPSASALVSHNLNGQKLGRKGRVTRERILAATAELLASPEAVPISLSAVARQASLGMTSLYNYFGDLTELLLAVLEPVMATAEDAFLGRLREHWSDDELDTRCLDFLRAYHDFWARHSRLLHLRNSMADNRDERLLLSRINSSRPGIALMVAQMGGDPHDPDSPVLDMATVVMIGVERTVTVSTDMQLADLIGPARHKDAEQSLIAGARLMEIAIRDTRRRLG